MNATRRDFLKNGAGLAAIVGGGLGGCSRASPWSDPRLAEHNAFTWDGPTRLPRRSPAENYLLDQLLEHPTSADKSWPAPHWRSCERYHLIDTPIEVDAEDWHVLPRDYPYGPHRLYMSVEVEPDQPFTGFHQLPKRQAFGELSLSLDPIAQPHHPDPISISDPIMGLQSGEASWARDGGHLHAIFHPPIRHLQPGYDEGREEHATAATYVMNRIAHALYDQSNSANKA